MEWTSCLVFGLRETLYAVSARHVREVFLLPELTPVEESPPWMAGVVNLRGKILPVIDLNVRFGHPFRPYALTDCLIVFEENGFQAGAVVNEVRDVMNVPPEAVEDVSSYGRDLGIHPRLVAGAARMGADIVVLLDVHNLLRASQTADETAPEEVRGQDASPFFQATSPGERAVFRERALNLLPPQEGPSYVPIPLAVVGWGTELYGVDLRSVREFADIRAVTPIPCCPEHIAGSMNLRGNILVLVDVRSFLHISGGGLEDLAKAVVVPMDGLLVGVAVEEVYDVVYLDPASVAPPPSAFLKAQEKHVLGAASYGGKMLTVLDLAKLLAQDELLVNLEV